MTWWKRLTSAATQAARAHAREVAAGAVIPPPPPAGEPDDAATEAVNARAWRGVSGWWPHPPASPGVHAGRLVPHRAR